MQGIADWFAGIWQQFEFNIIQGDRYTMLLDGLGTTATVALGAAVIGVVLGSLVALMRLSRIRVLKAASPQLGAQPPSQHLSHFYVAAKI